MRSFQNEYQKNNISDIIPNDIVSQYTYQQLSESSDDAFNSPKFYDYYKSIFVTIDIITS